MPRITFDDLIYFSLMNFYAAHKIPYEQLDAKFRLDAADKILYENLAVFLSNQSRKNKNTVENKYVSGVSFFYDMFINPDDFLPFGSDRWREKFPSADTMLLKIISDKCSDQEGGYITGGFLKDHISEMVSPAPFHYITRLLRLDPKTIIQTFFPQDFAHFHSTLPGKAGTRTTNTLAAALLGAAKETDFAQVLVQKESPYGLGDWGKIFRIQAKASHQPKYKLCEYHYEEACFLKDKEIPLLKKRVKQLGGRTRKVSGEAIAVDHMKLYVVKRRYELDIQDKLEDSRLLLKEAIITCPKEVFESRKEGRRKEKSQGGGGEIRTRASLRSSALQADGMDRYPTPPGRNLERF